MSDTSTNVTWLTQEAYDRLKAELDHLTGEGRLELARKIEAAREEGDLKENGGYHAAKDEQGKQEARIRQLEQMLEEAQIGAAGDVVVDGKVHAGMVVTAAVGGTEERFLLGSPRDGRDHRPRRLQREVPAGRRPCSARRSAPGRTSPPRTAKRSRSRSSRRSPSRAEPHPARRGPVTAR